MRRAAAARAVEMRTIPPPERWWRDDQLDSQAAPSNKQAGLRCTKWLEGRTHGLFALYHAPYSSIFRTIQCYARTRNLTLQSLTACQQNSSSIHPAPMDVCSIPPRWLNNQGVGLCQAAHDPPTNTHTTLSKSAPWADSPFSTISKKMTRHLPPRWQSAPTRPNL
jgi:hypothetical protein